LKKISGHQLMISSNFVSVAQTSYWKAKER